MTTPPDLSVIKTAAGEVYDGLAALFEEAMRAVHDHYEEDSDPDFGEASHDYAHAACALIPPSTTEALIARVEAAEARTVEADRECERQANLADERAERMGDLHARAQAAEARVEKLRLAIAPVEQADAECPLAGGKTCEKCPKCGATADQTCWPNLRALIRLEVAVREALTPTGGQ